MLKLSQIILIFFVVSYFLNTDTIQELVFPERYWSKKLETAEYTVRLDHDMLNSAKAAKDIEAISIWNEIIIEDQKDVKFIKGKLYRY